MLKKLLLSLIPLFLIANIACASPRIVSRELKEAENGIDITVPALVSGEHAEELNILLSKPALEKFLAYNEMLVDWSEYIDKNFTCFANYHIKYDKDGLMSIVLYGYQYMGGAHGASWRASVTFREKDGTVFTLDGLFEQGSDYQTTINELINAEIGRRSGWPDAVEFPGVVANTNFYLTEEALVIYYLPYEMAPFSFGLPTFVLDRYTLNSMFKEEIRAPK